MEPQRIIATAKWEIWYQDTFDRECPRQVETSGQGLVNGLIELWTRHLFETVQTSAKEGFSHFNLWWKQENKSIEIVGDLEGQARLRKWIFGNQPYSDHDYGKIANTELLTKVAEIHMHHIMSGKTSEEILLAAKESRLVEDFVNRLSDLK